MCQRDEAGVAIHVSFPPRASWELFSL
jgi:hypothetical protein